MRDANQTINQISAIKSRSNGAGGYSYEIDALGLWLKEHAGPLTNANVPIRLFTVMEVAIRNTVMRLVDSGPRYQEKSRNLWSSAKLDFEFALSLSGKTVTIGELVSHAIKLNSVEQIFGCLETIEPNIKDGLKKTINRWSVEIDGKPNTPIIDDLEKTIKVIGRMIEVRHILAHELPKEPPFSPDELDMFVNETRKFLDALEWFTDFQISGNFPLTQTAMNIDAQQKIDQAKLEVDKVLNEIKANSMLDLDFLNEAQRHWIKSAESDAALWSNQFVGGSIHSMSYNSHLLMAYQKRLEYLRMWHKREEGVI